MEIKQETIRDAGDIRPLAEKRKEATRSVFDLLRSRRRRSVSIPGLPQDDVVPFLRQQARSRDRSTTVEALRHLTLETSCLAADDFQARLHDWTLTESEPSGSARKLGRQEVRKSIEACHLYCHQSAISRPVMV